MTIRYGSFIAALLAFAAAPFGLKSGPQDLPSRIDSIVAPWASGRSPGLAVLVRSGGETVFQRGYGVRDLRTFTTVDARTDFRLASFTKQFTAMAIMLLVHDRKLRYDTNLTGIFPEFPAYGRAITVRHLLTHTSGLPDYEDLMEQAEKARGPIWSATHQIRDHEVLELLEHQTSGKFAPGSSWAYSNSGYVVLGLIVAKVSGEPFGRFLHDRIFQPLGMTDSLVYVKGENNAPNRAYGHSKSGQGFVESDQSSTSATLGDGGVYSNLVDLAKWDEALEKHALLSREEMTAALTPVMLRDGSQPHWPAAPGEDNLAPNQPVSYGFGWFLDPYRGHARMWHSGSTVGFRTVIERFTADRKTIVILANRADLDVSKLALEIADLFWSSDGKTRALLLTPNAPQMTEKAPDRFRARLDTTKGPIVIEFHRDWSPYGVDRFFNLAQAGYYDDTRFFRVVAGRWAQFGINGDPQISGIWREKTIPDDPRKESNRRGTVAFAFAVPNGRTTQLFINLRDNSAAHDKEPFVPIGEVVSGMDVADQLYSGYGEKSGSGIRAGKQAPLFEQGNTYLDANFPLLDRIRAVTIR